MLIDISSMNICTEAATRNSIECTLDDEISPGMFDVVDVFSAFSCPYSCVSCLH